MDSGQAGGGWVHGGEVGVGEVVQDAAEECGGQAFPVGEAELASRVEGEVVCDDAGQGRGTVVGAGVGRKGEDVVEGAGVVVEGAGADKTASEEQTVGEGKGFANEISAGEVVVGRLGEVSGGVDVVREAQVVPEAESVGTIEAPWYTRYAVSRAKYAR